MSNKVHVTGPESLELEKNKQEGCLSRSCAFRTWHVLLAVTIVALIVTGVGLGVYFITASSNDSNLSTVRPDSVSTTAVQATTTPGVALNYTADLVYRLPRDFIATEYTMYILPNMSTNNPTTFTYHGRTTIHLTAVNPTSRIVLHANSDNNLITVNAASVRLYTAEQWSGITQDSNCMWSVNDRPAGIPLVGDVLYVPQYEYVVLVFQQTLTPGHYVLQLAWDGPVADATRGFYYSGYSDINNNMNYIAVTHFSSINARRAFPSLDEPDIKATFNMRMLTHAGSSLSALTCTSSLKTATCTTDGITYNIEHFKPTVLTSTYQIAYVFSSSYDHALTTDTKGRLHRAFTRNESVSLVRYAADTSAKLVEYFEKLFMIDYDYDKLDHISVTRFSAGAMENWGLITYRDNLLWYNPSVDPLSQQQRVALIMSHEIAHMWFGNLVTITWFDDLWITEGWASYGEYLGVNGVHSDWNIMHRFINDNVWTALREDDVSTSRPLSYPVESNAGVSSQYNTMTYEKGSAVMHMMSSWLGSDTFWRGVRHYLKRYSYGNSQPEYLADIFTEAAQYDGIRVNGTAVLLPWVYQAGFPVVKLSQVTVDGKTYIEAEQERFLEDGSIDPANPTWQVPITVVAQADPKAVKFLLTQKSDRFLLDSRVNYFIGNHENGGYYRVNYDNDNWRSLIEELRNDYTKIDVLNRGMLVEDAFALARAGRIPYDIVLDLTMYLTEDFEYLPWRGAISNLNYIERQMYNTLVTYNAFIAHWQKVIEPAYTAIGWAVIPKEAALRTILRTTIISKSCSLDLPDCVNQALTRFRPWLNDEQNNQLDSLLSQDILCTSIRHESADTWQTVYNKYYSATTGRSTYYNALACSKEIPTLQSWLNSTYHDVTIPRSEFESIYSAITANIMAKVMCRVFFYDNWQDLCTKPASTSTLETIIANMFSTANTQEEISEMEKFANDHKGQLSFGEAAFNNAIRNAKINMKYANDNRGEVQSWLTANSLANPQKPNIY